MRLSSTTPTRLPQYMPIQTQAQKPNDSLALSPRFSGQIPRRKVRIVAYVSSFLLGLGGTLAGAYWLNQLSKQPTSSLVKQASHHQRNLGELISTAKYLKSEEGKQAYSEKVIEPYVQYYLNVLRQGTADQIADKTVAEMLKIQPDTTPAEVALTKNLIKTWEQQKHPDDFLPGQTPQSLLNQWINAVIRPRYGDQAAEKAIASSKPVLEQVQSARETVDNQITPFLFASLLLAHLALLGGVVEYGIWGFQDIRRMTAKVKNTINSLRA